MCIRDRFRTFLKAVYLYDDDRLKIVFGFTDVTPEEVEIALESADFGEEECSFLDRESPPIKSKTNTKSPFKW